TSRPGRIRRIPATRRATWALSSMLRPNRTTPPTSGCASPRRSAATRRGPDRTQTTGPHATASARCPDSVPRGRPARPRLQHAEREHRLGPVRQRDMRHQPALLEQGCERLARHRHRPAAPVVEDLQRQERHRAAQADAERLGEGLLAGESLREVARGIGLAMSRLVATAAELGKFLRPEDPPGEAIAPSAEERLDPVEPDQVRSDPDDHGPAALAAASRISRFISRTASRRPTKIARDTIAWPMWSSRTPASAATGWTLK